MVFNFEKSDCGLSLKDQYQNLDLIRSKLPEYNEHYDMKTMDFVSGVEAVQSKQIQDLIHGLTNKCPSTSLCTAGPAILL